jgi:hypothetical protein
MVATKCHVRFYAGMIVFVVQSRHMSLALLSKPKSRLPSSHSRLELAEGISYALLHFGKIEI